MYEWIQITNEPTAVVKRIEEYLLQYVMGVRDLYHISNFRVMENCDIIVSGLDKTEITLDIIIGDLRKKRIL